MLKQRLRGSLLSEKISFGWAQGSCAVTRTGITDDARAVYRYPRLGSRSTVTFPLASLISIFCLFKEYISNVTGVEARLSFQTFKGPVMETFMYAELAEAQ